MHASATPDGTVTVDVDLPGPGGVEVLGTHSNSIAHITRLMHGNRRFDTGRRDVSVDKAGRRHIVVPPNRSGRALVALHRRYGLPLYLSVWVQFTPTGGKPNAEMKWVRVLRAHHR
jgi:hypothetical protein